MRKTIIVLALLLVTPNLAIASWWNPLTWFNKPATPIIQQPTSTNLSDLPSPPSGQTGMTLEQVKDKQTTSSKSLNTSGEFKSFRATLFSSAAFRKCPSTKCEVIRYYAETAIVQVIGQDGTWYNIQAKDDSGNLLQGWMTKLAFVKPTAPAVTSVKKEQPEKQISPVTAVPSARDKALSENIELAKDIMPDVSESDDHAVHILIHQQVVPKTWATWVHIAWHEELLSGNKAAIFLCGNKLYNNDCPSGPYMCSSTGKASCQYDDAGYVYGLGENPPYLKTTNQVSNNIQKAYVSPPQPQQYQPSQFEVEAREYSRKLSEMKAQLEAEYKSAGGFWTASQLESNAMSKLKEMGIKPPTSLGGGLNTTNYTSVQCNSLNGGLDCYGSNGSRSQALPNGNGGYEIRGW